MTDSRVEKDSLSHFCQAFSLLIDSGVSIVRALLALEQEAGEGGWREAIHQVRTEIEQGASLSEALSRHPDLFPEWFTVVIKGGEITGRLQLVLQLCAEYQRKVNQRAPITDHAAERPDVDET
ncbi:MAG: type II secretion system F family protein, partial [Chloroflexi bacterium]|nr:type II secretion system F family protein [Chloroflexota bacterium]